MVHSRLRVGYHRAHHLRAGHAHRLLLLQGAAAPPLRSLAADSCSSPPRPRTPPRIPQGGVITITVPASLQNQLNRFSNAASGATATVTYFVPQSFDFSEDDARTAYKVMGYVFTAVTIVVLAMVIFLRRAIATSIKVIQVGAEAIQHLPSLIAFPLTTVAAYALFGVRAPPPRQRSECALAREHACAHAHTADVVDLRGGGHRDGGRQGARGGAQ